MSTLLLYTPVLPKIVGYITILTQGAHSSFSIQDSLALSAPIYDHRMESDPATADFMEVDGYDGDLFTNFSHSSMFDAPMDTLDDLLPIDTRMSASIRRRLRSPGVKRIEDRRWAVPST